MKKSMLGKNYTYVILIAVLFLLIIFTIVMLVQTKDYVGQAFRQYQIETKFSPEDISRFSAEYKEKTYETAKRKSQPKRLAASKPGSGNAQISWYSEEEYASCKIKQNCVDNFDAEKDETKQGTILYYDPKTQECYTATDSCKDNKYLIEYSCDNYLQSKSKSLNIFDAITCKYGCNGKQARCYTETEQQYGSCNDGIQNQDEQSIDCGGSCPLCSEKQDCSYDSDKDLSGDENKNKGINFAVAGYVISQGKKIPDSCNGDILKEKYCTTEGDATEFKFCSDGCLETEDGAFCDKKTCIDSDAYAPVLTVEDSILGIDLYSYDTKYSIPGSAEQKNSQEIITSGPLQDDCIGDDTVNEAYCNGNTPSYKQFDCPKEVYGYDLFDGCANGACCSNQIKCVDGDADTNAGKNIFKKSITQSPKICLSSNPSVYKQDSCGVTYCLAGSTDESIADESIIDITDNGYNCNAGLGKKIESQDGNYGDIVKEYYCDGTTVQSQWFSCPHGQACLQGECKELTCLDTDAKEPNPEYVTGSAAGIGFENSQPILKTFNDICIESNLLKEYKCGAKNLDYAYQDAELISDSIYVTYELVHCPGKCKAGKCDFDVVIKDPLAECIDSDKDDIYTKGFIEIIHKGNPPKKEIMEDECLASDNTFVKEWTCKDNGIPIYKKCENGCFEGKCFEY